MIPGDSPLPPRQYLFGKPSDRLYPHENNRQTPKVLLSFLYNGFEGSRFIRIVPLAATLPQRAHITLAPDFLRPRLAGVYS